MKEEELLVFNEELADRREARDDMIKRGEIILVLGLVLSGIVATAEALRGTGTMIFVIILCIFSAIALGLLTTKEVVLKDIGLFQIPGSNSIDFVYTVSQPPGSFY